MVITALLYVCIFSSLYSVLADTTSTTLSQLIQAATLSVDIVDAAGDPVVSPSVTFGTYAYSFNPGNSSGVLGISSEKIRVSNPTATPGWTLSIAATGGESSVWSDGGTNDYPYNDATDPDNGRLTVDAATNGVITPSGGCSNTDLSLGASATFISGSVSSITMLTAGSGADTLCYWDLTAVDLTQRIPGSQAPATYTLDMTLTAI